MMKRKMIFIIFCISLALCGSSQAEPGPEVGVLVVPDLPDSLNESVQAASDEAAFLKEALEYFSAEKEFRDVVRITRNLVDQSTELSEKLDNVLENEQEIETTFQRTLTALNINLNDLAQLDTTNHNRTKDLELRKARLLNDLRLFKRKAEVRGELTDQEARSVIDRKNSYDLILREQKSLEQRITAADREAKLYGNLKQDLLQKQEESRQLFAQVRAEKGMLRETVSYLSNAIKRQTGVIGSYASILQHYKTITGVVADFNQVAQAMQEFDTAQDILMNAMSSRLENNAGTADSEQSRKSSPSRDARGRAADILNSIQ
jgi:hypothetical protein